jgi:pimeloyl-ACP methyl ester carboxylesterase
MKRVGCVAILMALSFLPFCSDVTWAESPRLAERAEGFVDVNGVRLQYLDWGGSGPALIFLPGLGDTPYVFDDIAPAFTNRFHVITYARRGSGSSDIKGPYDAVTTTEDLRGLMDALKIAKADLVGYSLGGTEITEMAAVYPERVGRLVYFDGCYDWADPDFKTLVKAFPVSFYDPPSSALASLDAFLSYQKATVYPTLDDIKRIDTNLRAKIVLGPDGSVKYRASRELVDQYYSAMWSNKPMEYGRVHSPALAIYAAHLYDLNTPDTERRQRMDTYEKKYWLPYQAKSMDRARHELANVEVVRVPGSHSEFFMTDRQQVVRLTLRFLTESPEVARLDRGSSGSH